MDAIGQARGLGAEHGREAARAWWRLLDGPTHAYFAAYGVDDAWGRDDLPEPDLSGEWADGFLPADLTTTTIPPILRRYNGHCADCGRTTKVRQVRFWVNDMAYTVCEPCEKPYRGRICWPVRDYYNEGLGKSDRMAAYEAWREARDEWEGQRRLG